MPARSARSKNGKVDGEGGQLVVLMLSMFRIDCVGVVCVPCGGRVGWDASVSARGAVAQHRQWQHVMQPSCAMRAAEKCRITYVGR